jgi:hypothetical protein
LKSNFTAAPAHLLLVTTPNGFPIGCKTLKMLESDLLRWFVVRSFLLGFGCNALPGGGRRLSVKLDQALAIAAKAKIRRRRRYCGIK